MAAYFWARVLGQPSVFVCVTTHSTLRIRNANQIAAAAFDALLYTPDYSLRATAA